jgi:hypothetical protein
MLTCVALAHMATPAQAQTSCTAEGKPAALVELYTSEGCNSCPPAERWLNQQDGTGKQGIVPLALHVDYWDYIGWKDPYAQARFTDRQRQLAKRNRTNTVYTPGVFANGLEFLDWRGGKSPPALATPWPITLTQRVADGARQVSITLQGADEGAKLFLAVTESNLKSQVKAGENKGETLLHNHVVREWQAPKLRREPAGWAATASLAQSRNGNVVAFVEDANGRVRSVVAAAMCGL